MNLKMSLKLKKIIPVVGMVSVALLVVTGDAIAKQSTSPVQMATRLAELRKTVDDLSSRLEEKKEDSKGRIRSYATQKAEVEAEIQRANMRLAQLVASLSRRVKKTDEEKLHKDVLTPAVLEAIGMLQKKVTTGMPFKREERVAELDRLIRQMDDRLLHPANAFARLWDQTEDEFRLSRESGIYKQVITIEGKEILADVVRIGMVMMYFKTKDGMFGKTVYEQNEWSFRKITSPEEKRQVLTLFDAFKKQIRTGLFTLPTAISNGSK